MTQSAILAQYGSQSSTPAFKNRIINGAMMIDQRNGGASVTLTSVGFVYPVDRFFSFRNTGTTGITAQRVSSGLTDTPYAIRVQRTNGDTSTTTNGFGQTIETNNSYDFAGNSITLSFRARCGANFSASSSQITARIATGTGTDQGSSAGFQGTWTGQVNTNTNVTLTTSWQTFTVTLAAPSSALEYQLLFYWANSGTAGANDWVDITGVQLEKGSTATSFDYRPYGTELQLCQRYFQKSYDDGTAPGTATFNGIVGGYFADNNGRGLSVSYQVPMRSSATVAYWDGAGGSTKYSSLANGTWTNGVTAAFQLLAASTKGFVMSGTSSAAGTTAFLQYTASAEL